MEKSKPSNYRTAMLFVGEGSYVCGDSTFGDPDVGDYKWCYCQGLDNQLKQNQGNMVVKCNENTGELYCANEYN